MQNNCQNLSFPVHRARPRRLHRLSDSYKKGMGPNVKYFLPVCLAIVLSSSVSQSQTITPFDVPGSSSTQPTAISSAGEVTGNYGVPNSTLVRGFVRDRSGKIVTFGVSGMNTYPATINIWGQVAGIYTANPDGVAPFHGFLRQPNGQIITFDAPDAWDTEATTIDAKGQIVGWMQTNLSAPNPNAFQGFVRKADGRITLFDIDNAFALLPTATNSIGWVVGHWTDNNGRDGHGFLRRGDGKVKNIDVPAIYPTDTTPFAINGWGQIVGAYAFQCPFPAGTCTTDPHGFLRQVNGKFVKLDVPGMAYTVPLGIDFLGRVTGYTFDGDTFQMHGFQRELNGRFTVFEAPGSDFTIPLAMNATGEITGVFFDTNSQVHAFIRSSQFSGLRTE